MLATPEDLRVPAIVRETNRGARDIDRSSLPVPPRIVVPGAALTQLAPPRAEERLELRV